MGVHRGKRNVATAALNAATPTTVVTLPVGTLNAVVSISDGTAALFFGDDDSVADIIPAGATFTVWDVCPLAEDLAVKVQASEGTPTAKVTYITPQRLP